MKMYGSYRKKISKKSLNRFFKWIAFFGLSCVGINASLNAQQPPQFFPIPTVPIITPVNEDGGSGSIEKLLREIKERIDILVGEYFGIDLEGDKKRPTTPAEELKVIVSTNQALLDLAQYPQRQQFKSEVSNQLRNDAIDVNAQEQSAQNSLTAQGILNQLNANPGCTNDQCKRPFDVLTYMSTTPQITNIYSNNAGGQDNNMLNIESLLDPLTYGTANEEGNSNNAAGSTTRGGGDIALNFIRYVTGISNPITLYYYNNFWQRLQTDKEKLEFLDNLRAYLAFWSIGANNFHHVLERRMPRNGLGTNAGLPEQQANASELEVESFMAKRRLGKGWHDTIEQAPPITIARETLYLLAEMNYQLFQLRQQNERILTTLSASELMNARIYMRTAVDQTDNTDNPTPPAPTQ